MLPRDSADLKGKNRRAYGDKERHQTRRTSSLVAVPPPRSSSMISVPASTPRSSVVGGNTPGQHDLLGGEERPLGVGERLLERLFQRIPSPARTHVPEEHNHNNDNHNNDKHNENNRSSRSIRNHTKGNHQNNSSNRDNDSSSNIVGTLPLPLIETDQSLQATAPGQGLAPEQKSDVHRGEGSENSNHEERMKNSRPFSSEPSDKSSPANTADRPDRQVEDDGLISCAAGGFYMSEDSYMSENRNKREGGYKGEGSDKDSSKNNNNNNNDSNKINDDEDDDGDEEEEETGLMVGRKRSKSVRFSALDEYCNNDNGDHHQKVVERLLFYMDTLQGGIVVIVMYLHH